MDPAPGFHAPMHPMAGTGGTQRQVPGVCGELMWCPGLSGLFQKFGLDKSVRVL